MAAFGGFGSFDVYERIWDGVFQKNHNLLRTVLSLTNPEILDDITLSRKLNCTVSWTWERDCILEYRNNEEDYKQIWLDNIPTHPNYKELFEAFCKSVPSKTDAWSDRYLPSATKVCDYLTKLLPLCNPEAKDSVIAAAAGLYVLVCFFVQNQRKIKGGRILCVPPAKYNPVAVANNEKESTIAPQHTEGKPAGAIVNVYPEASESDVVSVFPSEELHSPESVLPFDFFEHVKTKFIEMQSAKNLSSHKDTEDGNKQVPDSITPSAVRQQKTTVLCSFELAEVPGFNSHAFIIEKCVKRIGNVLHPRIKLRKLSRSTRNNDGMTIHTFLLHHEQMSSDTICEGIIISVETNGTRCRLYSFDLTSSGKWNRFDSVSISPSSWRFTTVDIDKDGYLADREMEDMLDFCDVRPSEPNRYPHIPERTAISRKMDRDFLNYRILDRNTLKEIPKHPVRDQITGERQIGITVPCPGQMIVLEMDSISLRGDLLAVLGNLYGLYGCDQDELEANVIMAKGACKDGDPQMAFQYGAYLKCKGYIRDAESYLRIAAKQNIPGAKFELAELLLEQKNSAEVRQLIDDLWSQGFRTYGATQSIDLFGEHTQSN